MDARQSAHVSDHTCKHGRVWCGVQHEHFRLSPVWSWMPLQTSTPHSGAEKPWTCWWKKPPPMPVAYWSPVSIGDG